MPDVFGPGFLGAARLAQPGRPAQGAAWWRHHIENTRAYLEGSLAGDLAMALGALGELWHSVLEWQRLTQSPMNGVLMAEHTALAKLLVDCLAQHLGSGCADTTAAALGRNVDAQRKLFSKNSEAFADLFRIHVDLTGMYMQAAAGGTRNDFENIYAQALENGAALGTFTDRVFGGR